LYYRLISFANAVPIVCTLVNKCWKNVFII